MLHLPPGSRRFRWIDNTLGISKRSKRFVVDVAAVVEAVTPPELLLLLLAAAGTHLL